MVQTAYYPIRQKKYIVISALCIAVVISVLILDIIWLPALKDIAETRYELLPYNQYNLFVRPLTYAAMAVLVPALVSLCFDIRLRFLPRLIVLLIGIFLLAFYLIIPCNMFVKDFPFNGPLVKLAIALYKDNLVETQKISVSVFALSVFLFLNKKPRHAVTKETGRDNVIDTTNQEDVL